MFEKLIDWSHQNYSHLPWRKNRTLYTTLVSEIMLQQTTVSTVLNHFERFLKVFPDLETLSKSNDQDMLIHWKGLGYYRRARNLLNASRIIKEKFKGEFPMDYDDLTSVGGIGPYTANALLAIGANLPALALDANLERVLARFYGIKTPKGIKLQKDLAQKFTEGKISQEIHVVGPRHYNEALMDLGRSICMARKAYCELCPLSRNCVAFQEGDSLGYPVNLAGMKKVSYELDLVRFIVRRGQEVLTYKKPKEKWLAGQYEVPTFVLCSEDPNFKQYPRITKDQFYFLPSFKSAITQYKIRNYTCELSIEEFSKLYPTGKYEYHPINGGNLSTGSLKAINL